MCKIVKVSCENGFYLFAIQYFHLLTLEYIDFIDLEVNLSRQNLNNSLNLCEPKSTRERNEEVIQTFAVKLSNVKVVTHISKRS